MPEEPKITMTEFKTVVEIIRSDIKAMHEVNLHNFSQVKSEIQSLKSEMSAMDSRLSAGIHALKEDVYSLNEQVHSVKEQVALLHEGQIEIKFGLQKKIDRDEFASLERRVAKIESKIA